MSAKKRVDHAVANGLCLVCLQPLTGTRHDRCRGTHITCYHRLRYMRESGVLTEKQAIEQGLLLPHAKRGRKSKGIAKFEEA